jgi:hypothetical protein
MFYKNEVLKSCLFKLLFICLSASIVFAYSGGTGDVNSPYQIATILDFQQLMHTYTDWNKNFIMTADINLQYVPLIPIGGYMGPYFTGVFNGNNHIIRNARMSKTYDNVGLFGSIDGGRISNLGIEDINIAGNNYTGGLVGYAGYGSSITNCHATGAVHNASPTYSFQYIGGLVGYTDGNITNCYSTGTVSGSSDSQYVGGLAGYVDYDSSTISNCYSTCTVISSGQYVGGLVGSTYYGGNITNCYSTGTASGDSYVGGLVGRNECGNITNCYSTGTVSGVYSYVGGLVGRNECGNITNCYSMGTVNGSSSSQYVGGLVGENNYSITTNCYSTGAVSGYQYVGGLAGYNNSDCSIIDCCSASAVSGSSNSQYVGGLVGRNDGTISGHCPSAGNVSGYQYVGGWVGYYNSYNDGYYNNSNITNRYSTGDVNGVSGSSYVGGLVGYYNSNNYNNSDSITNCYSTGDVSADSGSYVGGLVGYYNSNSYNNSDSITNCYSTGNVSADSGSYVGGLVGYYNHSNNYYYSDDSITNCYSTGNVNGPSNSQYVGGLVGYLEYVVIVTNCYSMGAVSGDVYVGGLVGSGGKSLTNCYSTGAVSGTEYVGGLEGISGGISSITNCYSTGAVSGTLNSKYVGGIVGDNSGSIIRCSSTGTISGSSNSQYIGGLAGHNSTLFFNPVGITDCYSTGTVSGTQYIGGLVGTNDNGGKITDCYSAGMVSGSSNFGGLVGYDDGSGSVIASFWDVNSSGQSASAGGTGKTTTEMKSLSTFTSAGWNFITVWDINDGWTCPFFSFKKTSYSGGIGTPAAPYQIACLNDLRTMAVTVEDYNKCFILTADIDLAARGISSTAIIAPDTNPMNSGYQGTAFSGTFDGNGHKITHLIINGGPNDYIGLFGRLNRGGQIINLGVEDVNITANSRVGGIVGFIANSGDAITTVRNCYTTGVVDGNTYFGDAAYLGYTGAGGLAGVNHGNIIECYSKCRVYGNMDCIGGLVGDYYGSYGVTVISCYAAGAVDGNDYVGGLVGQCYGGAVTKCYSAGSVNGNTDVGGLVGYNSYGTIDNSFWDVNSSGQSTSAGGTGKTTAEMKTQSTFTSAGWDFSYTDGNDAIWFMAVEGYPILIWQISPVDIYTDGKNDFRDFAVLARYWMRDDCRMYNNFCEGADLNFDGVVDIEDLQEFLKFWLEQGIYE